MPLRRIFLRVILICLALAAAAGVLGVLTQSWSGMWRIIATMVITAVAASFMLVASRFVEKPAPRPAALVAMGLILVEFLLALMLTWAVWPIQAEDELGLTMFHLAIVGVPAVVFTRLLRGPATRLAAAVALGCCALTFGCLMVGTWSPGSWWHHDNWWGAAGVIGAAGVVLPACLARPVAGRGWTMVRWVGAVVAVVASVMAIVGIWQDRHSGGQALAVVASVAVVIAHANLTRLAPLKSGQAWLRWATVAVTVALFVVIDGMVVTDSEPEFGQRLAAAAGICSACGSLALIVLATINRRVESGVSFTPKDLTQATVQCPACQKKTVVPLGEPFTACAHCRLMISVRVREPRCPNCDYLLYMLSSDRCPECGTLVAAAPSELSPSPAA